MAVLDAFVVPDPSPVFAAKRAGRRNGFVAEQSSTVTYYYYRTSGGTRGSTTDLGAIPALAVIERTSTT
jgi:hypothetical protein